MAQAQTTVTTAYQASATLTSGSTTNGTSTDCRTNIAVRFWGKITNGATGPTTPCVVSLQASTDNSAWYNVASATGLTSSNGAMEFDFLRLYPGSYLRLVWTGNAGQSVTIIAQLTQITGVA